MAETIRIVTLEASKVGSFYGYGTEPEGLAWGKLEAFARPRGLMEKIGKSRRIFGFNNPNPNPGSPEYGYELWLVLEPGEEYEDVEELKNFPGGRYAVMGCAVQGDPGIIPASWKYLVVWMEENGHQAGSHQWLEEFVECKEMGQGRFTLDLYLPLAD